MSSYNSETLEGFDAFFGKIMAGLSPAARRKTSRKLGRALLKANLDRIRANQQPDGSPMERRKSRFDRRGRLRKKKNAGKMFPRLRLQREWAIDAQPNSVEIAPKRGDLIARIHHEGERGLVGKDGAGKKVYARYPTRRLLGFAREDEELAMQLAEKMLINHR